MTKSSIEAGEIHLWRLHMSNNHHAPESWLDQHEISRLSKFSLPSAAWRYRAFRCAVRRILGDYLGIAPNQLKFSVEQGGKPFVESPVSDLQFNLTHTADTGMLAVARKITVGIDIEKIRPMANKHIIAKRVFEVAEIDSLENTAKDRQDAHFFKLWTAMEARQKCLGSGIFGTRVSDQSVGNYQFEPIPGFCAAVAWSDPSAQPAMQLFDYSPDSNQE